MRPLVLCVSKGAQQQQATAYLVHLQPNGVWACESCRRRGPMSPCLINARLLLATANKGPAGETVIIVRRRAMLCLARWQRLEDVGRRWHGLDGAADDESASNAGLLSVRSARQRDDDVLERARAARRLVGPADSPLGRLSNRNCGCAAQASRSLAHF